MPKGKHHRKAKGEPRLGLDMRTVHDWDQKNFNKAGRPVAYCGEELYPRSLKFINIQPPATSEKCDTCYG